MTADILALAGFLIAGGLLYLHGRWLDDADTRLKRLEDECRKRGWL